jgi:hypothetical protein
LAAAQEQSQAGAQVEREEQDSPAFVLPDVDLLMGSRPVQRATIDAHDDVAEGDRAEVKEPGESEHEFPESAPTHLQRPVDDFRLRTQGARQEAQRKADYARRRCPGIANQGVVSARHGFGIIPTTLHACAQGMNRAG